MSDVEAIHELRTSFVEAFNRADMEAMARHLTDDSVGMPPKAVPQEGIEAQKAAWAVGFQAGTSHFTVTPIEVDVAGDLAVDRFHWAVEVTPHGGGDPIRDEGNCVWIDRRQPDGSWKVARAIWNSTQERSGPWACPTAG